MSRREHGDPQIEELNVGEASEPDGRGTGECGRTDSCLYLLLQNFTIRWHQSSTRDLSFLMRFIREKKKRDLFLHNYAMTVETLCPFSLHEDNDYYAGCFLKCLLASLLWWLYRSCSHRLWWWWASGTAGVSWWKCSTAALYLQSQPGECLRDHLKASASAWWCNLTPNPVFSHSVCISGNH